MAVRATVYQTLVSIWGERKNMNKNKKFNEGFLFGVAQCLANECPPQCAIDALNAAGVTQKEILESNIDDYDKEQFEDVMSELEEK